jgi:predicted transcriptional regulator
MALLEKRETIEVKKIPVRLPADVLEILERYARYLNRDKSEVIAVAIRHAVQMDDEFCRAEGLAPTSARRSRRAGDATDPQSQPA